MTTRVLITNDDGIDAPGLHALTRAAVDHGLEVVVAAPRNEASGMSAAMTAVEEDGQVIAQRRDLPDLAGVPAYGVAGSPSFITLIALHGAFGPPPDAVLSGINRGANVGRAVLHSGTVGAAFTAAANGCPAMAVSLDVLAADAATVGSGGAAMAATTAGRDQIRNWSTAAGAAMGLLPRLDTTGAGVVLNVNSPDLPPDRVRGVRRATLAGFGQVQITVVEAGEGFVRTSLEETGQRVEPGSDVACLAAGYVAVTAVRAVVEATEVDLSDLD